MRPLDGLISGVEYGSDFANMADSGYQTLTSVQDAFDTLKSNFERANAKMKVDVYEDSGVFQLDIYLDGAKTYHQTIPSWQASPLWIQSHWGSGVKFSKMDITER